MDRVTSLLESFNKQINGQSDNKRPELINRYVAEARKASVEADNHEHANDIMQGAARRITNDCGGDWRGAWLQIIPYTDVDGMFCLVYVGDREVASGLNERWFLTRFNHSAIPERLEPLNRYRAGGTTRNDHFLAVALCGYMDISRKYCEEMTNQVVSTLSMPYAGGILVNNDDLKKEFELKGKHK